MSKNTPGFVGADLASLCKEAVFHALHSKKKALVTDSESSLDVDREGGSFSLCSQDFIEARKLVTPSALSRRKLGDQGDTDVSSLAGLDDVIEKLKVQSILLNF